MASGVSSGVWTGSDFTYRVSSPAPAVTTIPSSKSVNNVSYKNVTGSSTSSLLQDVLPSSPRVKTLKTALKAVSKTPKVNPVGVVASLVTAGALYGLNQLYPDEVIAVSSSPSPAVSSVPAAQSASGSSVKEVNDKTVQIINNFSPEILGKLKVESDTDLITALIKASLAQNQSSIMNTSVLNTQLGMLNEQFFGFLAYLDLFLEAIWQQNEILSQGVAVASDSAYSEDDINYNESIDASLADIAETHVFDRTPSDLSDFHGNDSVFSSPRDIRNAKDLALARGEADTNSIGASVVESIEELFDDMEVSPNMLKGYIRFDSLLAQAKQFSEDGVDNWENLMSEFYR